VNFEFNTDEETQEFCREIVKCLEKYCSKSSTEAINLINLYWKNGGDFTKDDFRLHEDPYYWAMTIVHDRIIGDNDPFWYKNPNLYPAPKDFLDYWYK
jgi:hypothetical protein